MKTTESTSGVSGSWDPRFEEVLRRHLPAAADIELSAGHELSKLGLDSLGTIRLLLDLEESYTIAFPDERLVGETFETVASLWAAVSEVAAEQLVDD
ncbi:phosphopantetheine-binding protein [Streptomyces tubbatahanensis]|uniref:Phosphopantetheine-binding protein n=1 Tax=Streptomyces tubbatahanensis TaxID=2923272 RepID=A0ABY3XKZ5_9ACTN|nr:phosphopantetheine-binding protein [Streptomyces tubbatahanensis]UNS95078.1 phosphopantetheine-binding protein [Streptomyces tubbatahanensis]